MTLEVFSIKGATKGLKSSYSDFKVSAAELGISPKLKGSLYIGDLGGGAGKTETYYRTMSQADYDQIRITGELPSTGETFISPTKSFSDNYSGVTLEFQLNKGTTSQLQSIGVSNNSAQSIKDFGEMPKVGPGWNVNNAYFKGEGLQTNIGLGQGKGLEIFNSNIIGYKTVGGN